MESEGRCAVCGHSAFDADGDPIHVSESEGGQWVIIGNAVTVLADDDSEDWCIACAEASDEINLHPYTTSAL